jgi:hydroxymethylbilane synthase
MTAGGTVAREAISDQARRLRLGTRGSALALKQAHLVQQLLLATFPPIEADIVVVESLGDRAQDQQIAALGSQGIFTHTLEQAILEGAIDVAVHSAKDLPSGLAPGLAIVAVPGREDPRDCVVSRQGAGLFDLPEGSRVGTGSPRRVAMLRAARPDLEYVPIRGNVDTRRRAALDGRLDAVILAAAGLGRLGLLDQHVAPIPLDVCLPQAGQAALALEAREAADVIVESLRRINDPVAAACLAAERAVLAGLAAGCQAPVAAHAEQVHPGTLLLRAVVCGLDGTVRLQASQEGPLEDAPALGHAAAAALRAQGAHELLDNVRTRAQ